MFADFDPVFRQCPRMRWLGVEHQPIIFVDDTCCQFFSIRWFAAFGSAVFTGEMTSTRSCQAIQWHCWLIHYGRRIWSGQQWTTNGRIVGWFEWFALSEFLPFSTMKTSSSTSMLLLSSRDEDIIFRPIPLSANGDEEFSWCDIGMVAGAVIVGVEAVEFPSRAALASAVCRNSLLLK